MEELVLKMVQAQIGYPFKNLDLLKQAFIRRSYTEEHKGENNEVLEFIGDKALDFAVVQLLVKRYGYIETGSPAEFTCDYREGELTRIKSRMVERKTLARRMEELGFAEHLIMGKSDLQNNVQEELSVKEDLFEAILGAVTLDCNWDLSVISSVVEAMLIPEDFFQKDTETNYVRLIQEWEEKKNGAIPCYWFEEVSYHSQSIHNYLRSQAIGLPVIPQPVPMEYSKYRAYFQCELKLLNSLPVFRGVGLSKSEARMNVCKLAYEYLDKHELLFSIRDEIENPNKADAINQLEILARRGYFSIPTYDFEQRYDQDGSPIWKCECHIAEYGTFFWAESSSKKDAKKAAAFEMLKYVLDEEE